MIHESPSFIYSSALLFLPSSSELRQHYNSELLPQVKVIKGASGWGKCVRIFRPQYSPLALACWKDTIAVSLHYCGDIIIMDAITGSQKAIFYEHTTTVTSLAFSHDGTLLASGSQDTTIKLWDMQTGGVVKTFHGHTKDVLSVSISADCTILASGSEDQAFCLWSIQTGVCYGIIHYGNHVDQVQFLPWNPTYIMSVSGNRIWQWNIHGQQIGPTYDGSYINFSLNGTKFVVFNEGVIQVQTSDSGAIVAKLHISYAIASSCCISPDGRLFSLAASCTVYVWDITKPGKPMIVEIFNTHREGVKCLGFSSPNSLISVSNHGAIRFLQVSTTPTAPDISSSPIQSITLRAKDGIAISSDSDGVVKIWNVSTGLCSESFDTPARGSCMRDVQWSDNRWILVWGMDEKIHIWAVKEGELLQTIDVGEWEDDELRISEDGSKIFYIHGLAGFSIRVLDIRTGEVVGEMDLGGSIIVPPYLATDGSKLWMNTGASLRGWGFEITDPSALEPSHISPNRLHLDFIGGVRNCKSSLPPIEDTISGKEFLRLSGSLDRPMDAQWDGQYLVAGYATGDVLILKCNCTLSH